MTRAKYASGFTLIELMIAVAVIAILASIAYPSYTNYIQEARRTDAKATLMEVAGQLERCYTVTGDYRYRNADEDDCVDFTDLESDERFYDIAAPTLTASAFTLSADPKQAQASDTDCDPIRVTHQGIRTPDACW
ncbi:type IV pilin protein [Halomonas sp. YLGW01]|uniref:type IV pilin protein n=1 Tax=Halomonas sp. YLGW01 TaxID=2773308 RepID=UPI00177F5725|nr:type IV pilin protein [Halomonas sp. YLGW01]